MKQIITFYKKYKWHINWVFCLTFIASVGSVCAIFWKSPWVPMLIGIGSIIFPIYVAVLIMLQNNEYMQRNIDLHLTTLTNNTNLQIAAIKDSTNNQIETLKNSNREQIDAIGMSTKTQVEAINTSTQQQIRTFQELVERQISEHKLATEKQINAFFTATNSQIQSHTTEINKVVIKLDESSSLLAEILRSQLEDDLSKAENSLTVANNNVNKAKEFHIGRDFFGLAGNGERNRDIIQTQNMASSWQRYKEYIENKMTALTKFIKKVS